MNGTGNWIVSLLRDAPGEFISSVLTTTLLVGLGLLWKPIRYAILYKRHEFEFEYDSDFRGCEWDVQWEGFRLTISVQDVHNEHLQGVLIKKQNENPGTRYDTLEVSDAFHRIPNWPLQFKVSSIVRTNPGTGVREYLVYFVIRRRRW